MPSTRKRPRFALLLFLVLLLIVVYGLGLVIFTFVFPSPPRLDPSEPPAHSGRPSDAVPRPGAWQISRFLQ